MRSNITQLHSYVPLRRVIQTYFDHQKTVFHEQPEYKRLKAAAQQCGGSGTLLWVNKTYLVLNVLLPNVRFVKDWLRKDSDSVVLLTLINTWLTEMRSIYSQNKRLFRCMMQELAKPSNLCSHLPRSPLPRLVQVFKIINSEMERIADTMSNALPRIPGLIGELESYCGIKVQDGWMEMTKQVFRSLHASIPEPSKEVNEGFEQTCPKCPQSCSDCGSCQGWSVGARALSVLVGAVVAIALLFALNR